MEEQDCLESRFSFNYNGINYELVEKIYPKKWLAEKIILTKDKNGEEYLADYYRYLEVFEFGNELWFDNKSK